IYNIYDQDNDCMGRIYELATKGYGGDIQMFVAYDLKTKELINLRYIGTFSETPGFGSRVKEDEFLSQILNKPVDGMSIDTLSGATITSSAVKKAIDERMHI
ncbi:MAG: FMN-binding protein, partial [Turicibacter sanguinis]